MLFANLVPYTSRPTLFYDLRSAPFTGIYIGVIALIPWVAKDTLGASDFEVAILMCAPSAAHLFTVYWAHLVEHRPKMPFVFWSGLVARALMLCVGFALNSVMLVALAVLAYIVGNIATPAVNSIWRYNYPGTHRYRAIGAVLTVMYLVTFVTSLAVGWTCKHYDPQLFRVFFVAGGLIGIVGIFIFSKMKVRGETSREPDGDAPDPKRFSLFANLGILRRDRKFGKFMIMQTLSGASNLLVGAVLVRLIHDQKADYLEAALVLSVAPTVAMVMSMPFWGRILQNMNPWRGRSVLSFICAIGYVFIAFSGDNVWLVILGSGVAGIAAGGGNLLWTLQQMYFAPKDEVAKYMGVHCTLTGARGLIAPFLGIWLMGLWGTHAVYYVSIGGLMCAEVIALQMAHREHKEAGAAGHVDGGSIMMDDED